MAKIIPGIIRGNTIELLEPHGLIDGERILLEVRTSDDASAANGIVIASGETVDGPFWDEVLDEFYQRRKKEITGKELPTSIENENLEID